MPALAVIASQLNTPSLYTSWAGFSVYLDFIFGKLSFLLQYTNVRTTLSFPAEANHEAILDYCVKTHERIRETYIFRKEVHLVSIFCLFYALPPTKHFQ
jgi:hypothetical protein